VEEDTWELLVFGIFLMARMVFSSHSGEIPPSLSRSITLRYVSLVFLAPQTLWILGVKIELSLDPAGNEQ